MTFREPGFSPAPIEPQRAEPEHRNEVKDKLRQWLPRMAMAALPLLGCGREQRQAQQDLKTIAHEPQRPFPTHVEPFHRTMAGKFEAPLHRFTNVPESVKTLLDKAFSSTPAIEDTIVVFANPQGEEGESMATDLREALATVSTHHSHIHGDHGHPPSMQNEQEVGDQGVAFPGAHEPTSEHHDHKLRGHHGAQDPSDLSSHRGKEHRPSLKHDHAHQHAGGHFDFFQGGTMVNDVGEVMREVLDGHGHFEIPVLTNKGMVVIGMEKTSELTGDADQHAELMLKPAEPLYAAFDLGAGVQVGTEGTPELKLTLSAPMTDQLELWGGVHSQGEHGHGDQSHQGEQHASVEHHDDEKEAHEGVKNLFSNIQNHLDVGWEMNAGPASLRAGIEEGEAMGKLSFTMPMENGRTVRAELLLASGNEVPGALLKLTGNF